MKHIPLVAMFLIGIVFANLNPVCNGQVEEGTEVFDMQALAALIRDASAAKEIEVSEAQLAEECLYGAISLPGMHTSSLSFQKRPAFLGEKGISSFPGRSRTWRGWLLYADLRSLTRSKPAFS